MEIDKKLADDWLQAGIISSQDHAELTSKKKNKLNAVSTELDGIKFHSGKEANRYAELKIMEKSGYIRDLKLQTLFPLVVDGVRICRDGYKSDFQYIEASTGNIVVEDVKGYKGGPIYEVFKMKRQLVLAIYGIRILET